MDADLERRMAEALEGKFFWEPTSSPSDDKTPMQKEIYEAQKSGPRKIIKSSIAIIDETEAVEQFLKPRMLREAEIRGKAVKTLDDLRSIVAACYKVAVDDILRHTNNKKICEAKRHFYWAAIQHFPEFSIAEIGRQLGRNHTVIIHSRDLFAKNMEKYKEQIAYVDQMMKS